MTDFFLPLFFLRPLWLAAALLCIAALFFSYRRTTAKSSWWELMDSHIAHRLILAHGSHKLLTPLNLLLAMVALICIALAGPSFDKQLPDNLKDKASVIVLLANSDSMYAGDITPNRNRVAKQKIKTLRKALPGSQFGLITYAHSAHQVAPLSTDPNFLSLYLDPLEPKLMPDREQLISGLQDALQVATGMMKNARYPVNLLIMADQLTEQERDAIVAFQGEYQVGMEVLAIGTEAGGSLRFVEQKEISGQPDTRMAVDQFSQLKQQNIAMLGVTQNDDDVSWLISQIKQAAAQDNNSNPDFDWKDSGYLLAFLFLPLCLLLFRRNTWLLSIASVVMALSVSYTPTAHALSWDEIWWSPDQLGQKALERGDYAQAAELFEDSFLKGWSLYQLGDYPGAELMFRKSDTADSLFYLANTLAMQEKYKGALPYYGKVVALNGSSELLEHNVAVVKSLLAKANKVSGNEQERQNEGQIILQVGAKGKKTEQKKLYINPLDYSEEELNVWLDKVKSSPEDLLKTKFELQSQRKMIDAL